MSTPQRVDVAPGVAAYLLEHELPLLDRPVPCWSMWTDGLRDVGQREVTVTLVRSGAAREVFPPGLRGYVEALQHFAHEGRPVEHGGISGYAAPGPFDVGDFVGVAFVDALASGPIPLPPSPLGAHALAMLLLREGELEMAQVSPLRVRTALGALYRYYPWAWWCDPERPSAYQPGDAGSSLLAQMGRFRPRGATVTLRGDEVVVELGRAAVEQLVMALDQGQALALLAEPAADATAVLSWRPGQAGPKAITAEVGNGRGGAAARIAATFLCVLPQPRSELRVVEDGYVAMLDDAAQDRLRRLVGDVQGGTSEVSVLAAAGTPGLRLRVSG